MERLVHTVIFHGYMAGQLSIGHMVEQSPRTNCITTTVLWRFFCMEHVAH